MRPMKYKNAFVFAGCLLLATGSSLGLKHKQKKEKEKIKFELNTVTIPNEEQRLDSIIAVHRMLRDSIVFYKDELQKQSMYPEIKKQIPTISKISEILEFVAKQWHREYSNTQDAAARYKSEEEIPEQLRKKLSYLDNGIVSVPVLNNQRFDFITETQQHMLDATMSCFDYLNPQDVYTEYELVENFYYTLHNINDLLDAVDKSQNVIDRKKLQQLEHLTNIAITEFGKIYNKHQGKIMTNKIHQLYQDKKQTDAEMQNQMKKVANLKTPSMVEKIYQTKHKQK
jgi:hypothetical protein